jgi:Hydrolases of the alpha/beta superfamily
MSASQQAILQTRTSHAPSRRCPVATKFTLSPKILVRQILIAVVASIVLWTIAAMVFENKFIFFPLKYPEGIYEDARFIPNLTECWITTEDGVKIHGWFTRAESAIATLVIAHGNGGNISYRIDLMKRLQKVQFNVLMFDYRGYGKSEGSPDEAGVYSDGRAAFDYALQLPGVDPHKIILWGTSLGGAVAVDVAIHRRPAGLILESTFSSAEDVARKAYPYLPVQFTLRSKFNSIDKIPHIGVPLLQMHGNKDKVIAFDLGKKLFEAAREPKEFYVIEGSDHNDTYIVGGQAYLEKVRSFALRTAAMSGNERPVNE